MEQLIGMGGAAATKVTVVTGTTITCNTPAGAVGSASVVVTNTDGQSSAAANLFTYVAAPTASSTSSSMTVASARRSSGLKADDSRCLAPSNCLTGTTAQTPVTRHGPGRVSKRQARPPP